MERDHHQASQLSVVLALITLAQFLIAAKEIAEQRTDFIVLLFLNQLRSEILCQK